MDIKKRLYFIFVAMLLIPGQYLSADDIEIYKPIECPIEANYRFIFIVDNSGSMDYVEFSNSKATIDATIEHVLKSLPKVAVSVVQYGTSKYNQHEYIISVPFTRSPTIATNWSRAYGTFGNVNPDNSQDHLPGSLAKMRRDNVYQSGGTLDVTDADNVQFILFTDASRDNSQWACCTSLIAENSNFAPTSQVYSMFGEYDALKRGSVLPRGIKAQFTLLHNSNIKTDKAAGAAIASVGGEYEGDVEANSSDPDGSSVKPRRYVSGNLSVSDTSKILSLVDQVIKEIHIPSEQESFVELAVDVNKATWSTDNRAYLALFKPSTKATWEGNIKGYFLDNNGLMDINNNAATTVFEGGVKFRDSSQSFWSESTDGNNVPEGGAAGKMANTRNLFSNISDSPLLSAEENALSDENTNLTRQMLGASNAGKRTKFITAAHNLKIGDPLHTKPSIIRYADKTVVVAMTNHGFLHAIDATNPKLANGNTSGGEELWAFIPQELLGNIAKVSDSQSTDAHVYGLDGQITRWHDDENNDGIINGNDTFTLIFGMRRGGKSYYAIDLTDIDQPELKWHISAQTHPEFEDLQQTWSRMSLIRVKRSGALPTAFTQEDTDRVLVFGGGYDTDKIDDRKNRVKASGNAIYMIDKEGTLLWKTDATLQYSVPSDLTVLDTDQDGLADRIYAPDLGGQIWRVDFDNINDPSDFRVDLFADLGDSSYQPFFYPPSVSLGGSETEPYLAVAIGSGNRDQPLDEKSQNAFYMLKDHYVKKGDYPTDTQYAIIDGDLYDVTSYQLGSSDADVRQAALQALSESSGWKIELEKGEKSLSKVQSFDGVLYATSYMPIKEVAEEESCGAAPRSKSRLYTLDYKTGSPANNNNLTDVDENTTSPSRHKPISTAGIPSTPIFIVPSSGSEMQILVNSQKVASVDQQLSVVSWHAK